jgi:putative NADPH-quinone reductase
MTRSICLIHGHPHADRSHFGYALADAYMEGAHEGARTVVRFDLADIDFDLMRDPKEFETPAPAPIKAVQDAVLAADHLVVIFPLWLGTMPARLKGFFEQFARAEFAISASEEGGWPRKMLKGRSARVIVTMGMPATAYRLLFGAHGVKSLDTGILGIAGFGPIHDTLIGGVSDAATRTGWLEKVKELGRRGD